jgi:hypothetical protein
VDPKSQVREVLLRDKFLTQLSPDIRRRLQKLVAEGNKMLDQLVQMAISAYYIWYIVYNTVYIFCILE